MSYVFWVLLRSLISGCQSQRLLLLENLALRHQLTVLRRQTRKPKLRQADGFLWLTFRPHIVNSRLSGNSRQMLFWHAKGGPHCWYLFLCGGRREKVLFVGFGHAGIEA